MRPLYAALIALTFTVPAFAQYQPLAHERPQAAGTSIPRIVERVEVPVVSVVPRPVWWNTDMYYTPQVMPGYGGPAPNYYFGTHYNDPIGGHYVSYYGRRFIPPAYAYFPTGWVYP